MWMANNYVYKLLAVSIIFVLRAASPMLLHCGLPVLLKASV